MLVLTRVSDAFSQVNRAQKRSFVAVHWSDGVEKLHVYRSKNNSNNINFFIITSYYCSVFINIKRIDFFVCSAGTKLNERKMFGRRPSWSSLDPATEVHNEWERILTHYKTRRLP